MRIGELHVAEYIFEKIIVSVIIPWSYFIFASPVLGMSEQWGTDVTRNSVIHVPS